MTFQTDGRWIFVDFGGGWGLLEDEDSWCISFPVVAPGGDVPLNLKIFSAVLSGCAMLQLDKLMKWRQFDETRADTEHV